MSIPPAFDPAIHAKLDEEQHRLLRRRVAAWMVITFGAGITIFTREE